MALQTISNPSTSAASAEWMQPTHGYGRIAIVHDWLPLYGGAERVLEQIVNIFPKADIFSTIDMIPEGERGFLQNKKVHTTFLQKNSWVRSHYRAFLMLMPLAIEQFDLSEYDLVISSSYAVAKGVLTGPDQLHICYCHSPIRYAWDMQHKYLREANLTRGPASWIARAILHYVRIWDWQSHRGVDHFVANSQFIRKRIHRIYGRQSSVIHPPIDLAGFGLVEEKADHYITASRMVPYKHITTIVEAFNLMPQLKLRVIGDGPDFQKIKALAGPNIELLGFLPQADLRKEFENAKAFVFAAEEDFGIVPVEAQACGTPIIAYGKGGARETVIDGVTGLFFNKQTPEAIADAVKRFEQTSENFRPRIIRQNAERFSISRFQREFLAEVERCWGKFEEEQDVANFYPNPLGAD